MYCVNCGSKIEEGSTFCAGCGAVVPATSQTQQVTAGQVQNVNGGEQIQSAPLTSSCSGADAPVPIVPSEQKPEEHVTIVQSFDPKSSDAAFDGRRIFIMGIGSIAFDFSVVLAIIGIIYGFMGLKDSRKCMEKYHLLPGKGKAGKIMCIIGIILGFVIYGVLTLSIIRDTTTG